MSEVQKLKPDYLFEVSWEVCNKVGGIYTVLYTKARLEEDEWHERLIMIGPDIWKGTGNNLEFIEDKTLFKLWRQHIEREGLKVKIGRWNIPSNPIAVLVDFTSYFFEKNDILKHFWTKYQLDSLSGQWDYIEPAMFGYAAGKVIECFYNCHINATDRVVAQFHEWLTGTGILYLEEHVPQIATVFTTHATVIGRAIAGNGLPLYKNAGYNADDIAQRFQVVSKHSLEKVSARVADCFTTVSDLAANECKKFIGLTPDIVTPNGFDNNIVPVGHLFEQKRQVARKKLLQVASALFNQHLPEDSLLIIQSSRYEFKNKGIDVFIDSLAVLNNANDLQKSIIAFIFVPGSHTGPRQELLDRMAHPDYDKPLVSEILTHNLLGIETDPIAQQIKQNKLNNNFNDKVKVVFVPTYIDGTDGIFNMAYYDLLIGFDLSVFPSYYEPWGYTPLESIAFHIPTVASGVSGFGSVINQLPADKRNGVYVIDRNDDNRQVAVQSVAQIISSFIHKQPDEINAIRNDAYQLSLLFVWDKLIANYDMAYDIALHKSADRASLYYNKPQAEPVIISEAAEAKPVWRNLTIQLQLPQTLAALQKLSKNLWWSWNEDAIALFEYIDSDKWRASHNNPIIFLRLLDYTTINTLENDKSFLNKLHNVSQKFTLYLSDSLKSDNPLVAYFCMEYGLHNCLKMYSGGLGILAGDYLKEASDRGVNIVAVGLLYKNGYFKQSLSIHGEQLTEPDNLDFTTLPLELVKDTQENPLKVVLPFPGRTVSAQVWKLAVGRISLYLLDTFVEENTPEDKNITAQLYAMPQENRLKQEILLGIGGVQVISLLGIKPDIYHCNEGHAAFMGLARLNDLIHHDNLSFHEAIEVVRASTLFTTHTSLPAAMDMFSEDLLRRYLGHKAQQFNVVWDILMGLGRADGNNHSEDFSMAYFAANMAKEVNAVSKIHCGVTRNLLNPLWPNYNAVELDNIGYITNGVHYPTWVAREWKALYSKTLGSAFEENPADVTVWQKISDVPDDVMWQVRLSLKRALLFSVKERTADVMTARHEGPRKILEATANLDENAFLIGFARRFVTYKRPELLLADLQRLKEIINNTQRPVLLFFAGKAHPSDKNSIDLVRSVVEITEREEFKNKIFFLEDYDINLAKLLVQGVDLWINTPIRQMEASGTSGMKAMMNGVLNFSVLDGWWAEAYNKDIGWALEAQPAYDRTDFQNELDSEKIYTALENEIIPLYFHRNQNNIPVEWIKCMKASIAVSPRYTMTRMIRDYENNYYKKMYKEVSVMVANNFAQAKQLAAWKKYMYTNWKEIDVISLDTNIDTVNGKDVHIFLALYIGSLSANDIGVELVLHNRKNKNDGTDIHTYQFQIVEIRKEKVTFTCIIPVLQPGAYEYSYRIFPKHPLLTHRQSFELVKWI